MTDGEHDVSMHTTISHHHACSPAPFRTPLATDRSTHSLRVVTHMSLTETTKTMGGPPVLNQPLKWRYHTPHMNPKKPCSRGAFRKSCKKEGFSGFWPKWPFSSFLTISAKMGSPRVGSATKCLPWVHRKCFPWRKDFHHSAENKNLHARNISCSPQNIFHWTHDHHKIFSPRK